MIKEFYFRNEEDPNYLPDIIETSDEIECLIYQIRMCLESNKGDVLGAFDFGAGLNDMLFTSVPINRILSGIKNCVLKYSLIASRYQIDFNAYKKTDNLSDTCIVDISVLGKSIMGYAFDI